MRTRILFPCMTLLFLICGFASSIYGEPFRGPWGEIRPPASPKPACQSETRTGKREPWRAGRKINPLRSLVKVYRSYISPIDGKTCPMYPSCSKYSLLCFEKHGFFVGWVMTCDRLLHEADEMRKAPVICINGVERFHDPLENNDFWWHSER